MVNELSPVFVLQELNEPEKTTYSHQQPVFGTVTSEEHVVGRSLPCPVFSSLCERLWGMLCALIHEGKGEFRARTRDTERAHRSGLKIRETVISQTWPLVGWCICHHLSSLKFGFSY